MEKIFILFINLCNKKNAMNEWNKISERLGLIRQLNTTLALTLSEELIDMGLDNGDSVIITLEENICKEKHIILRVGTKIPKIIIEAPETTTVATTE